MAWLKIRQYAERTGYSYDTIYDKVREGVIPAYKLGREYRINPEEADAVLREGWDELKAKAERRAARKSKVRYFASDDDYIKAVKAIKSRYHERKEEAQ